MIWGIAAYAAVTILIYRKLFEPSHTTIPETLRERATTIIIRIAFACVFIPLVVYVGLAMAIERLFREEEVVE
jgi:uncharacterized sodium:solute symporter family permease YidK